MRNGCWVGVLFAVWTMLAGSALAEGRPNLLFILSDDHATNAIGCYGSHLAEVARTPNIDRLAAEGARLTRVYATNSICTPSRATILTGQYSHKNQVYKLNDPLDPDRPHVGKVLRAAGYTTALVGKWHLVRDPAGFDYWQVLPGQGRYVNPIMHEIGGQRHTHRGYSADVITDLSLRWLQEQRDPDKPFLLKVHYKAVHEAFEYPERVAGLYEDIAIPEPPTLFEDLSHRSIGSREHGFRVEDMGRRFVERGRWKPDRPLEEMTPEELRRKSYQPFVKAYLRTAAAMDENIGRLLDYLDDSGLAQNTIVVYTSDQGYFLGEHTYIDKRWFYEESARMPFVIRAPGEIEPGRVVDDLIENVDFAPLLLDFAGVAPPEFMQGRSFRSNLVGETPDDWRTAVYYRYWMHGQGNRRPAHYGIRTQHHKLIFFYGLPLGITNFPPTEPGWELYDLQADPLETNNIYDNPAYAELVSTLKTQLDQLKQHVGDTDERFPRLLERRRDTD